jgi:3-deoxy-D-manno-octulosonic-acid transferase
MKSLINIFHNLLFTVILFFYRVILMPIFLIVLQIARLWNQKIDIGLKLRTEPWPKLNSVHPPIWIHAASGEFEYAKPIIREFKKTNPNTPVLVTYFSPSYKSQIEKFPGVDAVAALPLDFAGAIRNFIKHYRPQMLLIARTDVWPELIHQCKVRKIPTALFSVTIKKPHNIFVGVAKRFYYWLLFSPLKAVFFVSDDDVKNVGGESHNPNWSVAGDSRFDQALFRLQTTHVENPWKDQTKVGFLFGSTWPTDDQVLLESMSELSLDQRNRLQIFWVPHEFSPTTHNLITQRLDHLNMSHRLWTDPVTKQTQVVIVNQVGILANLYESMNGAFVGGSFKSKVHSVMEPLFAGCVTAVGPHYQNNREAVEFSKILIHPPGSLYGVNVVKNKNEMCRFLTQVLETSGSDINQIKKDLKANLNTRTGASAKISNWICQNLQANK